MPVPRLLQARFVVFSGGKLEIRKGQDIVIQAFKKLLEICPDALLIASWCNESASLSSIAISPYVSNAPANGDAESIACWLESGNSSQKYCCSRALKFCSNVFIANKLILQFSLIAVRVVQILSQWRQLLVVFQRCYLLIQGISI